MSLDFLSPWGALAAVGGLVPVAALVLAERRARQGRRVLGLAEPSRGNLFAAIAGMALVAALFGLALAQPVLRSTEVRFVRTDAEVVFVLDTSRSMLAVSSPGAADRLDRARAAAERLRTAVASVPAGIASMTDRVLPHLFPTADRAVFAATLDRAIRVEQPPPLYGAITVTTYAALADLRPMFVPGDRHRVAVLLTDGESRPFQVEAVARALGGKRPIELVVARFWSASERVFRSDGAVEAGYRPDPVSRDTVQRLAAATGGESFDESSLGAAAAAIRLAVGTGPVRAVGREVSARALGPYAGIAALVPLLLLLRRRNLPERRVRVHPRRRSRAAV